MKTNSLSRGETRHQVATDVKALIAPIAAYVAATDDPRAAVAQLVSELIGEAISIEVAAYRHLDRGYPPA